LSLRLLIWLMFFEFLPQPSFNN